MNNEKEIRERCIKNIRQYLDEIHYMFRNHIATEDLITEELLSFSSDLEKVWWYLIVHPKNNLNSKQ